MDYLAKYIFIQDVAVIEDMNTAMTLIDAAIKVITAVKFFENYMHKSGRLSWENYKESIDQARYNSLLS